MFCTLRQKQAIQKKISETLGQNNNLRMSSASTRRRKRSGRRRLRDRNPSVEVIDAGIEPRPGASTCIDLTCEDDDIVVMGATPRARPVVDLTSINDSPIVIVNSPDSPPRRRRRRGHVPTGLGDSDSDEDLLELPPFDIPDMPKTPAPKPAPAAEDPTPFSPDRTVSCPVCLDSTKEIVNSGRQVFSTNCGHVFCNECITDAIKAQKKCPSCRKKLTIKQIHPIFI